MVGFTGRKQLQAPARFFFVLYTPTSLPCAGGQMQAPLLCIWAYTEREVHACIRRSHSTSCPAQPRESLAGFLLVHGALFLSVSLSLCFFHYHWDVNVTAPMHCTALHVTVHACLFRYLHHPHRTRYLLMRRTGVGGRRTARGENENCMVYKRYGTRRGEATSIFVLDAYSCTIGRTVLTTV